MSKHILYIAIFLAGVVSFATCEDMENENSSALIMSTSIDAAMETHHNDTVELARETESSAPLNSTLLGYLKMNATDESGSIKSNTTISSYRPTTEKPTVDRQDATTFETFKSSFVTKSPLSCNATLDPTPNLSPFWLKTELASVALATNPFECHWRTRITESLLALLLSAVVTNDTLQVQLVSVSRVGLTPRVKLVYYVLRNGACTPASRTAIELNSLGDRSSAILGYRVAMPTAVAYEAASSLELPWQLLAIAAACALLTTAVLATAAVLSLYFGCLRPRHCHRRRRLTAATAFEEDEEAVYMDAGSLRPVPHMRANPKISYSSAGIDAIADQVTRRLEAHMSELMLGWRPPVPDSSSRPDCRPGSPSFAESAAAAAAAAAAVAAPLRVAQPAVERADVRALNAMERQRNKERLRNMQLNSDLGRQRRVLPQLPQPLSQADQCGDSSASKPLLVDKCSQPGGDSGAPDIGSTPRLRPRVPRLGSRAAAESAARRASAMAATPVSEAPAGSSAEVGGRPRPHDLGHERRAESMLDDRAAPDFLAVSRGGKNPPVDQIARVRPFQEMD